MEAREAGKLQSERLAAASMSSAVQSTASSAAVSLQASGLKMFAASPCGALAALSSWSERRSDLDPLLAIRQKLRDVLAGDDVGVGRPGGRARSRAPAPGPTAAC